MPLALVLAALPLGALACRREPRESPLDARPLISADRLAILLHPNAPFWRQRAPDTVRARFETTKGAFVLEAYRDWGPHGVDRLYNLVRSGYFDDSRFHRVNAGYIVQFGIAGDPVVAATWRDRAIPDDPPRSRNARGTFAFSMRGPNDRRTQIYINLADNARNDAEPFTILGRVVQGMDVVDRLYSGYGETSGGGMRGGRQDSLFIQGNAYLDRAFPKLDRLLRATLVDGR
jgi:peptidyl-prolyl cis-trans isomerase A (cyclophilin A)